MNLIRFLAEHHVPARREGDEIVALERYTINGVPGETWKRIPATLQDVRDFLGY